MPEPFAIRPLGPDTWEPYAELIAADGGIWGSCWCLGFHPQRNEVGGFEARREAKRALVMAGEAKAALVFDGETCLGWAQYGRQAELPHIKNRRGYDAAPTPADWRFACHYTRKGARHRGVMRAAITGALDLIAAEGGGRVEAFPEEVAGRKVSGSFLWNGTLELYEALGFHRERKIGKHKWVVHREVAPA
ncbi:GNAT family N-acetyltransferase [Pseudoroseicyclus sp. CXY001]|uniref:GNAT family N-acetyltransferase n=1 Tax=Pseudoroseicyclus sp. CXY001 TaxID=3242492 RepID=UPI003570A176